MQMRTSPDYNEPLKIYDDLYGLIKLQKEEKRIVDTWPLQRLREIKQLGLAHYVFPGATHSRFSHCIGVCHIAGEIANRVFKDKPEDEKEWLKRHARMAGLLHDIGHLPLSHSIEGVYKNLLSREVERITDKFMFEGGLKLEELRKDWAKSRESLPFFFLQATSVKKWKLHELLSAFIIKDSHISNLLIDMGYDLDELADAITGRNRTRELSHVIHSDLDADKMDYLMRDAKATGICYSQFDINYLLPNLVLDEGTQSIAVNEKALYAVEHYLLARYYYFLQILHHKKRDIYELLAAKCAEWMIEMGLLPDLDEFLGLVTSGELLQLDDNDFLRRLRGFSESAEVAPHKRKVADVVLDRGYIYLAGEHRFLEHYQERGYEASASALQFELNLKDENDEGNLLAHPDVELQFVKHEHSIYKHIKDIGAVIESGRDEDAVKDVDVIKIRCDDGHLEIIHNAHGTVIPKLTEWRVCTARYYFVPLN